MVFCIQGRKEGVGDYGCEWQFVSYWKWDLSRTERESQSNRYNWRRYDI